MGVLDDPGLLLELPVELARAPARVAGEDAEAESSGGSSRSTMPTVPTISFVASAGSGCSPIAVTAFGWTGPPT